MSGPSLLHAQLVDQAWQLARKEPRRPLPSSLRRAVSTGYFALHHFLLREATRGMLGTSRERAGLREVLARAFEPDAMSAACRLFARAELDGALARSAGLREVPRDLRRVAWTFLTLRHHRLRADYDPAACFDRAEALLLLGLVEEAMRSWRRVRGEDVARVFLLCLLTGDRLARP